MKYFLFILFVFANFKAYAFPEQNDDDTCQITISPSSFKYNEIAQALPEPLGKALHLDIRDFNQDSIGSLRTFFGRYSEYITHINASYMKMTPITLDYFMQSLPPLTNLQRLDLSWCNITAQTLPLVTAVLPSLPSLKGLNLSGNKIADEGAEILTQVLSHGHIEDLKFDHCDIKSLGGRCLADALTPKEGGTPPALKRLSLWMCNIGENVFTALLETLPHNKIEQLFLGCLRKLNLSPQQAETVTQHLLKATHLKELDLSGTYLRSETQKALFNALAQSTSIEKLRLIKCGISPEGVQALSRALRTNSSLKELVLNYNIFGSEAGRVLFNALLHNNSLQDLEIIYICRDDESDETRNEYGKFIKKP